MYLGLGRVWFNESIPSILSNLSVPLRTFARGGLGSHVPTRDSCGTLVE